MNASFLKNHQARSPLLQQKQLRSLGKKSAGKSLLFSMNLTTLIDAFCILVIFLLSNMNGQLQNIQVGKNIVLPGAYGTEILKTGVVVRWDQESLYVDDQKTSAEGLTKALLEHKSSEKNSLIIQADKDSDYEKISLLLRAGAQAGYETYAFAVLPTVKAE